MKTCTLPLCQLSSTKHGGRFFFRTTISKWRQTVEVRLCFQTRSSDIYVVALKLMHTNSGFGDSNSDMTCAIVKHKQVDVHAKACTQNEYKKRNVFPLQPLKTKEYNSVQINFRHLIQQHSSHAQGQEREHTGCFAVPFNCKMQHISNLE